MPDRSYAHVYPLAPAALRDLAYLFEDAGPHSRKGYGSGPGAKAVTKQLWAWCTSWGGRNGTPTFTLTAEDCGDRTVVRDLRPIAAAAEIVLEGTPRAVLKACDSAQSRDTVLHEVRAHGAAGASSGDVMAALEELKASKLVLEWGGRILSLPVTTPVMPYPSEKDFGYAELGAVFRRVAPASIARRSVRSPYDMPVTELFSA